MLTSLQIRNYAIVDRADLEFATGMTVLTGETGAGKSILVDAMGLILGERGGTGLVRGGAKRAELTAEFDLSALTAARAWLDEHALDSNDDCLLRRVIAADGRSRAFINGNAVPLQSLKTLGEMLVDIHGQHFHQSLGHRSVQRDLLDHSGDLLEMRAEVTQAYAQWRSAADALDELAQAAADRTARLELLRFQCQELDALDLKDEELETLQIERQRLQHSGRLAEGVGAALRSSFAADSGSAHSLLTESCRTLEPLTELDGRLTPALALLQEASIQASEAADLLSRYSDGLEMDPARRDQVEERLDAIYGLARKHQVDVEALQELHANLHLELHNLEHAEERGAEIAEEARLNKQRYLELAHALSDARLAAAQRFSAEVSAAMADLGMPGGVFLADVARHAEREPRAWGLDDVTYLISANPGQPPQPLAKVASGGELSRMSLAIQVIASDGSAIPTMVFDEVDSGIGGGVAEMVGRRLHGLGGNRQVFCVTHLAQVAGQADHHFRVIKVSDGKTTKTGISDLNSNERIEELARMIGGVEISQATRDHAAELLRDKSRRSGT